MTPVPAGLCHQSRRGTVNMPPALAFLSRSLAAAAAGGARRWAAACLVVLHLAALGILLWTEDGLVPAARLRADLGASQFRLAAGAAPPAGGGRARARSWCLLILLSQFKHDVLLMTVNFLDVMIIDVDTVVVPAHGLSQSAVDGRGRGRGRAAGAGRCSGGSIRSACGCASALARCAVCFVALVRPVARGPERPLRGVRAEQFRLEVRALRRSPASSISTPAAISNPTRR